MTDVYLLGTNPAEGDRLSRTARDLERWSAHLLDRVGVEPGWQAIDVGCGPQGILGLLSERVGSDGRVVGLDVLPEHAAMARAWAAERRLSNVEVFEGDVRDRRFPAGSFDVVHARIVMVNLPDPAEFLSAMVELTMPGGAVAVHELDFASHLCAPACEQWDRLNATFQRFWRLQGADPNLGRRLPELLRNAGLEDVGVDVHVAVTPVGDPRRRVLLDVVSNVRSGIVERGLLTEAALDELTDGAERHLADPDTLVVSHLHVQAWGRRPRDQASLSPRRG
jgi:ubiquinone/menaquinone biosynthesis C-methylase UbiE